MRHAVARAAAAALRGRRGVGRALRGADADTEAGFITIQYVYVIGTSMILLVMFANVIVAQYGRGVIRSALDEGVRAGARVTSSLEASRDTCLDIARQTRADLLGGPMGAGVVIECAVAGDRVTATADVTFQPWVPAIPAFTFTDSAIAVREIPPPAVAP